jgi:hypothetical protein
MPAPKPVLKYLLLPEVREMKPGNPAQWYLRCFAEQRNFFFSKQGVAQRNRYLSAPLSELRSEKIRSYGGGALTQADWAARLDAIDWQVLERVQQDGLDLRQPELEPLQILANALKARFRIEIAGGHFDEAIVTAKTMFAFARHLGENPTHAANLLGLIVAHLALDALEEMIQQPGCPNLYWALTDLPNPLVDLRKGFQGDRVLVATELGPLREDAVLTEEELEKMVSRLSGVMGYARVHSGQSPRSLRTDLAARTRGTEKVRAIRDRLLEEGRRVLVSRSHEQNKNAASALLGKLIEMGSAKEVIQKMSPLQLVLIDEKREFEAHCDERMKFLALAPWQIDQLDGAESERGGNGLLSDLMPQVIPARREQARLEQRIALLRHIEALRLHAAGHDGKLPEKLSDIAMPLPNDPFTGKPFVYDVEAATAHLRGSPPRRGDKNASVKVCYDVTLQK